MKDLFGNKLLPGHYIVYATRTSTETTIKFGIVKEVYGEVVLATAFAKEGNSFRVYTAHLTAGNVYVIPELPSAIHAFLMETIYVAEGT